MVFGPTRQMLYEKLSIPLNEEKELYKNNYQQWTNICIRRIIELRDKLESGMYLTNQFAKQALTNDQVELYKKCHKVWLNPKGEKSKQIYKSYECFVRFVRGKNIEQRTINSYEVENIIKLSNYLIFQYNKALGNMSANDIVATVDYLLNQGVILEAEADIYAVKANQDRTEGIKRIIKDILLCQGKDADAIDCMLQLVKKYSVANKLKELVEQNNYSSVVQIIDEVKTLNK